MPAGSKQSLTAVLVRTVQQAGIPLHLHPHAMRSGVAAAWCLLWLQPLFQVYKLLLELCSILRGNDAAFTGEVVQPC